VRWTYDQAEILKSQLAAKRTIYNRSTTSLELTCEQILPCTNNSSQFPCFLPCDFLTKKIPHNFLVTILELTCAEVTIQRNYSQNPCGVIFGTAALVNLTYDQVEILKSELYRFRHITFGSELMFQNFCQFVVCTDAHGRWEFSKGSSLLNVAHKRTIMLTFDSENSDNETRTNFWEESSHTSLYMYI